MTVESEENQFVSSLGLAHMPNRDVFFRNGDTWIDDKKAADKTDGLWRIHNNLYDFSNFIKNHPGGQFWLEMTKGTDITEAFECHHISTTPNAMLDKFFVRPAQTPRCSPFTFKEDGFYRTLKRNIREALKTIPKDSVTHSKIIIDTFLILSFIFSILACKYWSYSMTIIAGVFICLTNVVGHNYYHQKDNFRMYYCDITMSPSREWRIVHVLSHHLHTNSIYDLQAYGLEPLAYLYPHSKSAIIKYGSLVYVPLIAWPILMYKLYLTRLYRLFTKQAKESAADALPLLLPTAMYIFTTQPLISVLKMWILLMFLNSFLFSSIGFTGTHFHPDIFIDGDTPRSKEEMDWGINQLDTVADRYVVTGNHFLGIISFGDHALHHLFPSLDHGVLQYLYPVLQETMKEFNLDLRMATTTDLFIGYFRRLKREKPNLEPPNLQKK